MENLALFVPKFGFSKNSGTEKLFILYI